MAFGNKKENKKVVKEISGNPLVMLKMKYVEGELSMDEFKEKYETLIKMEKLENALI